MDYFRSCLAAEIPDPFVPETMINLEVWLPLGYNLEQWAATGNLEECGLLGPGGRYNLNKKKKIDGCLV